MRALSLVSSLFFNDAKGGKAWRNFDAESRFPAKEGTFYPAKVSFLLVFQHTCQLLIVSGVLIVHFHEPLSCAFLSFVTQA